LAVLDASVAVHAWEAMRELIPPLSKDEYERLSSSLRQHGIQQPILVLPDGRIIDGLHRWMISKELGIECPMRVVDLGESDAFTLGLTLNIDRRQLSFEQIGELREAQKRIALNQRARGKTQEETAAIVGVDQSTVSDWETEESVMGGHNAFIAPDLRYSIPQGQYEVIHRRHSEGETEVSIAADYKVTPQRIGQVIQIIEAKRPELTTTTPDFPNRKYRCIVIDPPWPTEKIVTEARPRQGNRLDYPVMSLEQIEALPVSDLAADGCHIYLWVTHRFLPDGLRLFEIWGVRYQCMLTWVKPTGVVPFSWMYNTEHVLFGRIGALALERNGMKLSFEAASVRYGHSTKPEYFYERARAASPEPRLEMFARRPHEGFEAWGDEAA